MRVKDIMQGSVLRFSEDAPIKQVAQIIFSTGVSGAPVVKGDRLVGIITEEDIVAHMYPGMKKGSEKGISKLMNLPISTIMNKDVKFVEEDTTIAKAQDLMLSNNFSRVPVVDKNKTLLGIVSEGDIFRQVMQDEIPSIERDKYLNFMSQQYDVMINWDQRFEQEFPSLFRVFRREKTEKVLDLGVWTGAFSIALAEEGLRVTGLDNNSVMIEKALGTLKGLPKKVQDRVKFVQSDFTDVSKDVEGQYDTAISLGNSLVYLPGDLQTMFKGVRKALKDEKGIIILQVLNTKRVLEKKDRLLNFTIQTSKFPHEKEHLYLEFFDKVNDTTLNHNLVVFGSNEKNWIYKGTTTIPIKYVEEKDIEEMLKNAGFTDVSVTGYQSDYQGEYSPISFVKPYDEKHSDWMVISARKG